MTRTPEEVEYGLVLMRDAIRDAIRDDYGARMLLIGGHLYARHRWSSEVIGEVLTERPSPDEGRNQRGNQRGPHREALT